MTSEMPGPKPGQSVSERTEQALKQAPFFAPAERAQPALSEAKRLRLVKESKCPTERENAEIYQRYPAEVAQFGLNAVRKHLRQRSSAKPTTAKWIAENLGEKPELHTITNREGLPTLTVGSVVESLPHSVSVAGSRVDFAQMIKTGELKPARHRFEGGAVAVISRRVWSNEWRIRTQVDQAHGLPPEQSGLRYTDTLSLSGARKLGDSCSYMALKKGGYSTFLTLTFDEAGRQRVADRRSDAKCTEIEWVKGKAQPVVTWLEAGCDMTFGSIQQEASRFLDAAQKVYQRGWINVLTGTRHEPSRVVGWKGSMIGREGKAPKGAPVREGLHYCWVAECPKNERGQDNPHLHVLMKWQVPYSDFEGWAARLEKLWGQGFAHLEKIKEPEKAGAYMAKAAGYLTKAQGAKDQGRIRGNRYAISKPSRAPDWECFGRYEAGVMGSLIADAHDYFTHLYGHHFRARKDLNEKLALAPKGTPQRHKIGKALQRVREALNGLPAVISKYQITFRGTGAISQFLEWARDDSGKIRPEWLPAKCEGDAWRDCREKGELAYKAPVPSSWARGWEQRKREKAAYLENQRRRRWERWTGGDRWWAEVLDWERRYQAVPEHEEESRWERQNWGFA